MPELWQKNRTHAKDQGTKMSDQENKLNDEIKPNPDNLTEKRKLFVMLYLSNGFNATQAAIGAGYSEKTAYSIGSELLKNPEVRAFIKQEVERQLNEIDETKLQWFNEVKGISFTNHHSKMRGLELLGRFLGMTKEDQSAGVTIVINSDEAKMG